MIKLRKLLACLMIACMAFSLMPLAAFATEGEAEETIVCEHPSLADGVCTVCKTVVQEQSDTQDNNGTAGENGGGAAGGSTEGGGTTGDNGTAGENGGGAAGGSTEGGTTGGNGTTSEGGSGTNGSGTEGGSGSEGGNGTEGETGETNAVAKIGETKYATLAEAVDAMNAGDTVTLLDCVTEDVIFNKNGTIDLVDFSITGVVAVQANVTFVGGSVNQGDTANAAIVINSGSLTLDGTTVTGGNGISVETTEEVSVIVGGTVKATEGYGICQNVSDAKEKGTLNVTSTENARIEAKTVGVEIINGSYTSESKADRIECPGAVVLKIDAGSYNIAGGMFVGFLSFGKGVTGSITGGDYTSNPSEFLKDDYIAVDLAGLYKVAQGTKVGDVYVYAETVKENASTVSIADGVTVVAAQAKTDGAVSAINKDAVLSKASGLKTGDNVEINVSLKAEVKEAPKDANGGISSATYSLTPEFTLNVKGGTDTQTIPYDASMLSGSEITVTVPLVDGFTPNTIVHIHADGSRSIYTKGNAASTSTFVVAGDTVSFKVTSFSDFVMYANAIVCEVLDETGAFQKGCGSFSDAWHAICDAADNGKSRWTIKLLQDVSIDDDAGYSDGSNALTWKLDLAGKTLSTNNFYVYGSDAGEQSIAIMDSSAAQTGQIVGTGTAAIDIGGKCKVTLESGSIVNTNGIAVNLKDNKNINSAHFIMNGGALNGATALTAASGTVTISGGTVTGTVADVANGGTAAVVVNDNVTMTLTGGSVTNTNSNGVAVSINGTTLQFTMSGCTVIGGTKGIAMYGGSAQISNGTIAGATAINAVGSSITITGGTLDSTDTNATQEVVLASTGSSTVAISGGSFGHKVPSAQCAVGYAPTEKDNSGRYSVALQVAQSKKATGLTTEKHATVQAAIDAAGAGGTVTLLADSSGSANVQNSMTIDGSGKKMGTLNVNAAAEVTITNLKADAVRVGSASAAAKFSGASTEIGKLENSGTVSISEGKYKVIGGTGTYSITGGLFGTTVEDKWCAKVPVSGKTVGSASSLTKYTAVANTDPATKNEYPYTVTVAPAPKITNISNSAYFQRNSNGTLTIYTDRTVDELVRNTNTYQQDQYPYRCLTVTSANGTTNIITPRYYTVTADDNGNAVITISNEFLKYRTVGTYSVQVEYTTGVTQWETFRVGTSPKTGDESNIGLWIGIMACSAIIIGCGAFVLIHKSKKNKK